MAVAAHKSNSISNMVACAPNASRQCAIRDSGCVKGKRSRLSVISK